MNKAINVAQRFGTPGLVSSKLNIRAVLKIYIIMKRVFAYNLRILKDMKWREKSLDRLVINGDRKSDMRRKSNDMNFISIFCEFSLCQDSIVNV